MAEEMDDLSDLGEDESKEVHLSLRLWSNFHGRNSMGRGKVGREA